MGVRLFLATVTASLALAAFAGEACSQERAARAVSPPDGVGGLILSELRTGAHSESKYRGLATTAAARRSLSGSDYTLVDVAGSKTPRIAVRGASGPVALLVRLADREAKLSVSGERVVDEAKYALITLTGTTIAIYAYFDKIPEDRLLSTYITGAVEGRSLPLARFDPNFVTAPGTGPNRFILK